MKPDHQIPQKYLLGIGHIAVSFASLNDTLELFIISLLGGTQRIGQIVAAGLGFSQRLDLILSLSKELFGDLKEFKDLEKLMNCASKVATERNRVMHSGWGTPIRLNGTISRTNVSTKGRKGFMVKSENYSALDLRKVGDEMLNLSRDIQLLSDCLIEAGFTADPFSI